MGSIDKVCTLLLVAVIAISSLLLIKPVTAEVENISTSCYILVDNVVEGQPVTVTVQIFPAPPAGEVFSNISVGITSPLQGISGNGPWDQTNILTDSNGVAKVTFNNIATFGSPANWNVWVYFGGQYLSNSTMYYQPGHWESIFFVSAIQTQTPSPTTNPTPLSPTPTPTVPPAPSVPEFSWLMILPLFIFMLSIAVMVRLRKRSINSNFNM